jgi:multidrug efflux pump subunit AcrA (membrane-fusion protein)
MKKSLTKPVIQSSKLLGVVVLSAALAAGCGRSAAAPQKQAAGQEQQIKTVKVAPIAKQTIGEPLEQVADVVSSIQLDVIAKSGGDVQEILKKRGDFVNKGDVIFKIDPTDVQLQREQGLLQQKSAQAQLIKAKQDLDNSKSDLQNAIAKAEQAVKDAEKNYNKLHNDYDAGLATKQQLDQAETQLNNLRMDLDSARKKLKTLETTDSLAPLEVQAEAAG